MLTAIRNWAFLFALAVGSQSAASNPDNGNIHLTVVATNDLHGGILEQTKPINGGVLRYGGLANFASYVKVLRERLPNGVILLDAGDMFQGTLISNMAEGQPVIDAYNALGYDAAAIGNHEFDFGPVGSVAFVPESNMDPIGALRARIAQAKFPILSANIRDKATNALPNWMTNDGTTIIERRGVKVGIFGLTTTETPQVTLTKHVEGLNFLPIVPEAVAAACSLRARGAKVVIALVHLTGTCKTKTDCGTESGEIFDLAKKLPKGMVDLIVSGHAHTGIAKVVNDIPVIQSYANGRSFGTVDLEIDPASRRIVRANTRLSTGNEICGNVDKINKKCSLEFFGGAPTTLEPPNFLGATIVPDQTIAEILSLAEEPVKKLEGRREGIKVPNLLQRKNDQQGDLGSVFTDAMRTAVNADIALINSGGLRTDLQAGDLTYGDLYSVFPFENRITVVKIKGSQLKEFLQLAYRDPKKVSQISGAQLHLSLCESSLKVISLMVGGAPISEEATYRVAIPDFLAEGGEGFGGFVTTLPKGSVEPGTDRERTLRDDVLEVWRKSNEPLVAPTGERIILEGAGQCKSGKTQRL